MQIQSTANIAVIGINYVSGFSNSFLALPTSALGKTYVVSTRLNLGCGRSLKSANFGRSALQFQISSFRLTFRFKYI